MVLERSTMKACLVYAVLISFRASFIQGKLGSPGGPQSLHYEAADVIKVFSTFEDIVAISDSDNDTILECLSARRTDFNYADHTVTYVWTFPSTGEEVPFYGEVGDIPGTVAFTTPEDADKKEATIYYTDYTSCIVVDVEYHGHQCSLWTKREVKDAVPQDCIDHFVDTCGVIVPPHSRDLCPDGEGDY